ncbi:hypothetical protein SERLA73DRAFT_187871 [Serpula lacrymans var. lacrymans S7.3]|uniref:Uncharacterized protein n=2 Tax=Serpula lacrymans var. lacrymans TaxID=341189 RepID=F8QAM0_SERL3|nr:uncharacterized protein SERLADRAFT_477748 [Serpula lacrymans var. lacrymans S7.9]EGN94810.1 hypothetical protein SERLA73DRAFT_187871 [Serpula lacrymans var. lacrymans S7.3]EGO20309.1 hypothetical protein SERLADRAFT_477748 [Serpula lacrymans var. lacrymans S7.9]
MHSSWSRIAVALLVLLISCLTTKAQTAAMSSYFIINQPGASSSWKNGSPYPVMWTKGLLDGVNSFDVEITRLSEDGLYYVARNVPAKPNVLNILLQDVPVGDDYFVICLNSTAGITYAVSSRFSVVASNSSASQPSPYASAPTVTVSGAPNPVQEFLSTLGPSNGGAAPGWASLKGWSPQLMGMGITLAAAILGGTLTIW